MATIKNLLQQSQLPLLEKHVLLQHALGVNRAWLLAHDTDALTDKQYAACASLFSRRTDGEPIAYIVGFKEFYGYQFKVDQNVLIPRPETELLVELALGYMGQFSQPVVLDLGTGSGAIAITLALQCPQAVVSAIDNSTNAVAVAQKNAQKLGAKLNFYTGNWYDIGLDTKLLKNSFDLIVSNPPYVSKSDQHLQQGDLRFEPAQALTDYADGLTAIKHIVSQAPAFLKDKGALYIEHGWDQAAAVRAIFIANGFSAVQSKLDLAGIERITYGFL